MNDISRLTGHYTADASLQCSEALLKQVRALLADHGRLAVPVAELADDGDLFAAGLTSLATVNLMLAVEDTFDIEFPDAQLTRRSFESIAALSRVIATLRESQA